MTETISNPSFTGIYNFRDVGRVVNSLGAQTRLREKTFYRSGRLDDATRADRERLVSEYGLSTVIDLRTKSEHIRQAQARQGKNRYKATVDENLDIDTVKHQETWDTVYISFVGRSFELNMLKQLRWWQIIWFLTLMLLQFRMAAIRILGRNVLGPKGLVGLSKDSLRFCQAEILQTLEVMTDFKAYPILVHCTQGKDRSGLILMLILFVLGVPLDIVRAEYALSDTQLELTRASMIKEVEEVGMDAEYTRAPGIVVDTVWDFLQEEYGGVDGYLDMIGFGEQKRQTLRKLLLMQS
ncbi:hypothetical protein D9758_000589 [Tetrapyrgos nigripes]|uniref:Tyrosine specific protein phosphatases domain-containing protein n=1 Tax=Tetrapyrgos nigripes TaxID=182062 RepID=A0A8H5GZM9_9AGAR|nr:hypothetical protein D9758_000589 [Tetrapyrgos nigripes]